MKVLKIMKSPVLGALVLTLALSACGSRSKNQGLDSTSGNQTVDNTIYNPGNNTQNLPTAPSYSYALNGYNGNVTSQTKIPPNTESLLRIKITALPNANFSFGAYGCMSVQVAVDGTVQRTIALAVPGFPSQLCSGASNSQILDFSASLAGTGSHTITFNSVMSDNCYGQYGAGPYTYECMMRTAYRTHSVSFTAQIQTDGYWMQ
jgi:hypothetical protein